MLEGAVARIFNQLLGKYVVDLDTENLNVGIFSGHVQLTDLKLKPEALYELNLPIEVKAGTIGKVWVQIPWTSLWNQPVVVNIEDLHIIVNPIVTFEPFDEEKNKRLLRAFKKKILEALDVDRQIIGGPSSFSEHLLANILNNLQLTITNIHVRYEDDVSCKRPLAAGLCIGSITAETTNSKWKAVKSDYSDTCYYLIKMESFFVYWNHEITPVDWNLPSQYYKWRNSMSDSLKNFSMNNEDFEFLLKPMTVKIKMTISKANTGNVSKITSDLIIQDCNLQLSKEQFKSISSVTNSLSRMFISWNFFAERPKGRILENIKDWWKYAYKALLEQRIRPYTWSRIKSVRQHYKNYVETYKQIILNPNDTELKLDAQILEDQLSVINIVIGRQQARLLVQSRSMSEKNFWSSLPSPERTILCEKIGFSGKTGDSFLSIDHKYNMRIGNVSVSVTNQSKEILNITLTQCIGLYKPDFLQDTYKMLLKIEGLIVEGCNMEENLTSILSSEHLSNSPAYFLKIELEKFPSLSKCSYKFDMAMDSVEFIHHKQSIEELMSFFNLQYFTLSVEENFKSVKTFLFNFIEEKLIERWEFNLNIKIPYLVFPENGCLTRSENILIIDFGRYIISTELCQKTDVIENATQMELEELLYSKLKINCSDLQVLFCDNGDNWKDAMKEKDTDLHFIPKTSFSALYARCLKKLKTLPHYKFNINFQTFKFNLSERRLTLFFKFFNIPPDITLEEKTTSTIFLKDSIKNKLGQNYLLHVQNAVSIEDSFIKTKRGKMDRNQNYSVDKAKIQEKNNRNDMNEAYARYVDLPGLEDNISPHNNITTLFRFVLNEFSVIYYRSSDSTDRQYLMFRLGMFVMDVALMTYGPAYQISLGSILLTDKLHTTGSGQYLDLMHSPVPSSVDVLTILYRKVSASCPDFWTHFHGVETSLVADIGTIYLLLHQEAINTLIKYSKYIQNKIVNHLPEFLLLKFQKLATGIQEILHKKTDTPVPPGSVKFSHSARLADLNVKICDSDYDIVNIQLSALEMDFLFRANERFVFRSYLSNINVEHLSDDTLYSKVLSTDQDKVFEIKYVRHASNLIKKSDISSNIDDILNDGSFKLNLGQIHITFLYKLIVQLQRFLFNLDAVPFIEKGLKCIHSSITKATNTLKTNKRIQLAINICGPVVLLPQKSSSANVLIIDLGEFFAENFFKECSNDTVENILIKWNNIIVTRGVVSLTSALEMQETLIEPVNLSVGVKRFTNIKTYQKHWDVDGIMDKIQITLGQKDLSIILSTYSENIAEGKIIDLFPYTIKSQTNLIESDDTVKNLEAFFCEPKQKNIVMKFSLDGIKLLLFFDSGELLSSPIRDLNHGLCTLEIQEINTSAVIYTDRSLDGKLSVDTIFIEEIGPEASSCGKGVLQSPMADSKNNNCNITVNKPPIIDITFHQNKAGDKSMDIIIGKLSLNLSVPFCEKLALFIVECLPRDNVDIGIINHGYEADFHQTPYESHQENKSLAISLRINKPEFVFLIETTSNRKRYFITKCEILSDYSRHSNQLNFVVSLSGFHTLFYDLGSNNSPYTILKHCDMEFSKCYLQDKSDKLTLSISSFYIQLCSTVVHSINDVLNDIIEHFKVPELELKLSERRKSSKAVEIEDIWEPKVLTEFVSKLELLDTKLKPAGNILHELLIVPNFDIIVIFELEEIQVLILKITAEITAHNWSSLLNCTCELSIQANYYNESLQGWEPLIDPVVVDEKEYKPWDVLIKVFQDKALPMVSSAENKLKKEGGKGKKFGISGVPSEDDEDSGENMVYLEPMTSHYNRTNRRVKTSLSTFLDDSDSENEDNAMEKLAAAISDLFTGDWNESEDSDCEHSSDADDESDENIKVKPEVETVDLQFGYKKSINILIDAKETLNVTITPTFLRLLNEILTIYSNKTLSVISDRKSINVTNDIGPQTKVELYEKNIIDDVESDVLVCSKTYEKEDSAPSSPLKNQDLLPDYLEDINEDKDSCSNDCENVEILYDVETVSSLQFPIETTPQLYEKLNKHFMKIHIPNFLTLQTNCSKNNWEKLMRLRSQSGNQIYHIAAKHVIGKYGRNIVISSPLQIKNETCFALSLLYEPSVLQMLNLEPLGDITNPFETTMRIAVLEAYEQYNVPLYIAYHCKLFIQPAYAEGHYVSNTAIWWQDLASELDLAYNLLCTPKTESNLEVFSLRVIMKRNFEITNSLAQLVPNYVIHLLPPLILFNNLPYAIDVENIGLKQVIKVDPGEKSSVYCLDLSKDQKLCVKINFQSQVWSGTVHLTSHLDEKIVVLTTENKESCKHLAINIKTDREASCNIFFYTPYWIVNKTGLPLQIKATATNSVYESANEDILLFTYKRHGKQTLSVQVYESNWSNEFGLECAGTTGLVVCKDVERKKKYLFFLNIALSNICPRLTKIVMILPSFLVCNNTTRSLRFMENNEKTDLWQDLLPYQTVIFWPETFSMQMYVKYRDSKNFSQAFFIASQHQTVLKMDKGTAITVKVTGGKTGPFRVTFNEYRHGDCPVYIRNYCTDLYLKIQQQGQSQVTLLNPNHGLLYTWDDPTKPREFIWNVYNNKTSGYTIDISKDGYGEERIRFNTITSTVSAILSSSSDDSDSSDSVKTAMRKNIRKDKIVIYWVCYRGGAQRTLVFTQEPRLFNQMLNNYFHELCDLECLLSFSGLGFSIFTSETAKKEHMYLSLLDMPAIWEVNIGHKWKTLTLELASWIEDKYRMHAKKCQVKDYIHIDFEKMFMLKPFFAELRRTYYPALYFHFRKSLHYHYLNAKVHSIQIDNRYSNDVVLYTELSDSSKGNCFLDLMLCRNSSRDCDIYKNIKISIGNVFLNIEYDLFTKLYNLLGYNKKFLDESTTAYRHDMTYIHALITAPQKEMSSNKMTIIENFTFSGFNIQLNISGKTQRCLLSNRLPFNKVLDYLFPVNISPYMPMEGVHHKIYSIEETDLNNDISSVLFNLWNQTSTQFLQQYYSLVLGQQVLVNPFALQSVQAVEAAQSELEKMANVSLYGSRCLLGHINMSPAALEQCITDIFINQNIETIQRIRRHGSYYKTKTLPKVIAASCRNFRTGVPNALSQLIVKNQNSSLNCDAEMFFKTTGKALLSLVTRHPDDKSNSVEVAKEALRRATLLGEPIRIHQRLTRYSNKYLGIKPFSNFDSIGTHLLETVGNGRFINDIYWTHAPTDDSGKSVILVSLEHIIKLSKCRLWGPWEIEWSIAIDDVETLPKVSSTELIIKLRDIEKNNVNQVNICGDKETLLWLHEKIGQAIIVSIENKSWSVTDM